MNTEAHCVKDTPGTSFFLTLFRLLCVWSSAWTYVDNYREEDDKIERLLKMVSNVLFSPPLNLSHHLFCADYINHAVNM